MTEEITDKHSEKHTEKHTEKEVVTVDIEDAEDRKYCSISGRWNYSKTFYCCTNYRIRCGDMKSH
jgi:hypothetical protein